MSSKKPRSKVGALDSEINFLSKILFGFMIFISALIIVNEGFLG